MAIRTELMALVKLRNTRVFSSLEVATGEKQVRVRDARTSTRL